MRAVDNCRSRQSCPYKARTIRLESMSSNRNKLSFRQSSLNYEPPTINPLRPSLVKQNSEDSNLARGEIKITLNAKSKKNPNDLPPTKIAWEEYEKGENNQEPLVTKKCPENRKPVRSLKRQSSVDQDSILSCKEDIINKLRLLLKEDSETPEKQNLSIFLNQSHKHPRHYDDDDVHMGEDSKERNEAEFNTKDKSNNISENSKGSSLFQFRNNVVKKFEDKYSSGHMNKPKEPPNIIVAPVPEIVTEVEYNNKTNTIITDNSQPINNVIIRPTTAKSRRELFGKRTNSAFNSFVVKERNNQRAPLQRSSSAPIRPEQTKSKFLSTKRKLKTNKKRDIKSAKKNQNEENSITADSVTSNGCNMKNGAEIITMVSLVSPASSDVEEIPEIPEDSSKDSASSPKKSPSTIKLEDAPLIAPSLRKIVKQVSFQQSSIHAIRSFSAGFPGRKNSVATSMLLGGSLKRSNTILKKQEKNISNVSVTDDDARVPKRRLLRSHSAHVEITIPDEEVSQSTALEDSVINEEELKVDHGINNSEDKEEFPEAEGSEEFTSRQSNPNSEATNEQGQPSGSKNPQNQQFFTANEKECWKLYQKMSDKGVKVNYDTLLRGMLTPTEYRNRRQSLAACASFDTEETTENLEKFS